MTYEEAEVFAREVSAEPIVGTLVRYDWVEESRRDLTPETLGKAPTWCLHMTGLDDHGFPMRIHNRAEWERFKADLLDRWPEGIRR